jgi:hypothetical protein
MAEYYTKWIGKTSGSTSVIDPIIEYNSANISMFYGVFICLPIL